MIKQRRKWRLFLIPLLFLMVLAAALPNQQMPLELRLWARANGLSPADYPAAMIELYRRNPDAREFVRHYPMLCDQEEPIDLSQEVTPGQVPLLMQWDERWGARSYNENWMALSGCGPTCMSMAAIYLTGDTALNPWAMAQFAEMHGYNVLGNGTSWSFFTDGAAALGLDSTPIPTDRQRIMDNLEVGNPIVCIMGPGDFTDNGHFVLFVGAEDGKIRVNDPNSLKNSEKLWEYETLADQIQGLWVLRL